MFSNKRKTIGVFMERAMSEFQNRLCQGIITKAEELGYNVAVFTAYGNYGQNERYFVGDQTLWELPFYEDLSGVILALDTMVELSGRKKVVSYVKKYCRCPVVSIREIVEGATNLLVDNKTCMEGIIDHFVKDHGMKRLCFMTGPEDHWDARERLECFLRKMKEYGLPVDEHQYFWGDYWKGKGKAACDWFFQGKERPEAIVCANDHMAMAVVSELNSRGIRVPEEICVSGYDGLRGTLSFTPSVTTVEVPFYDMGIRAVEVVDQKQECPQAEENVYFEAVVKKRESCGCMKVGSKETMDFRKRIYELSNEDENRQMQFHFMSIHLSECHTLNEVSERITYYSYNIEGYRDYCLCLCEGILQNENPSTYTDRVYLRIAMKDRNPKPRVRIPFNRRDLLPAEMTGEEPQIWYFAPIHFQDKCFGYEAFRFYDVQTTGRMYLYWNIIMGNQIQNILNHQNMQMLVNQLEFMYDRDALTGIYNRRGFENYANPMLSEAKEKKKAIFLSVIDLDGMKQINDNYGHVEGDFALRKVCEAVQAVFPEEMIQARTGGDEFEVMGCGFGKKECRGFLESMAAYLDDFNASGEKEYDIHASYGFVHRIPIKKETVEDYIRESDQIMYINKVKNKTERGEALR